MSVARRITVVGPTGSGKTTVARELSARTRLPCVELDDLRYRDDWTPVPDDELRDRVMEIVATDGWILDGNYAAVRDLTWGRADLVVWLDLPKRSILPRLVRRTLRNLLPRNREQGRPQESWRRAFGGRSIVLWGLRSHGPLRNEYERSEEIYGRRGTVVVRLRSSRAVASWLGALNVECASGSSGIEIDRSS